MSVIIYCAIAWNSTGYYDSDEHYQIIEFAGSKLGLASEQNLAWEYHSQIRPTLQPTLCYIVFKALQTFSINNPYQQTFVLRLLTAILTLIIINFFVRTAKSQINESHQKIFYFLSFLLWIIPWIGVRFSSETWSGLMFLLSLALLQSNKKDSLRFILMGITLSTSFLFRYQSLILSVGLVMWLLIIKKESLKNIVKLILAGFIVVIIGICIDTWFYHKFVITSWNYFYTNIIQNVASRYGILPWYFYIVQIAKIPTYFIGIPVILSFLSLIIKKPKSIYLWTVLPFIVIHSIIPHKEARFIFPVMFLFPMMITLSYQEITNLIKTKRIFKKISALLIISFLLVDMQGLTIVSQKSEGDGKMEISAYIHKNFNQRPVNLIYCPFTNPYRPWDPGGITAQFYLEKNMKMTPIKSLLDLNDSLIKPDTTNLLVIFKSNQYDEKCKQQLNKSKFKFKKRSIPVWIEKINCYEWWFSNGGILFLYEYEGKVNVH